MEQKVKVSFYLKKNEVNEEGKCPVMARLIIGQSESVFSAKMTVPVSLWALGRAAGKSLAAGMINRHLDGIMASAMSHYRELSAVRENVTAEDVKNLLLGMASGQETLPAYFRACNENFDKRVGVNRKAGTAKAYWGALNHLTKYLKVKYNLSDIPFTSLDRSFIDKYDLYLRIECGLAPNTILWVTALLKTIVRKAMTEGIITSNPFAGHEPEHPVPNRKYLSGKELDKLMTTPLACPKRCIVRDMFLFSCFTGISYGDMCKLTEANISAAAEGTVWIRSRREKNGNPFEIPLLKLPLQILERYRGTAPEGRLLPVYSNSAMNCELKRIAETCGIDRRLTFHMGRHTYASEITLSQGVPIETVSRMLGHTRITTTQIYAKITDEKIDEDMKALNERVAEKFQFAI